MKFRNELRIYGLVLAFSLFAPIIIGYIFDDKFYPDAIILASCVTAMVFIILETGISYCRIT